MEAHSTPIDVRFGDTDMFGHVNNAAFATYFETGRLAFFRDRLGATFEMPGGEAGSVILARLALDFRRQLLYGATAQVTTEVERVGKSSISLLQKLISAGEVVAEASSVVVAFDYESQRSIEVPPSARKMLLGE